jgi:hypothetical protein
MIFAILGAGAAIAAANAIDAERAYAAMAQTRGQWTAFRATAAPDALMFVPEPVRASDWLAGKKDPPVSVIWWPARGWVSCDGRLAVNYGPWIRKGGKLVGTFTTIWVNQAGHWRWRLDRGGVTEAAVAAGDQPPVARASCRGRAGPGPDAAGPADSGALILMDDGSGPVSTQGWEQGALIDAGASPDRSLRWEVRRIPGRGTMSHVLRVWRWDGESERLALLQATERPARSLK